MQQLDLLTIGRCSLDLFSEQIGAPFVDIESFSTQVGGSPTNIAIGTSRLGLKSGAVTAVGDDMVGDFVRHYLRQQGVITDYVYTKPGRTALAVVGIEPPNQFPLVFYRDAAPDQHLNIDDAKQLPLDDSMFLLVVGSNFASHSLGSASLLAAKLAHAHGATTVIDLDLRPSLWQQPSAFALGVEPVLPYMDVVIGTEDEIWALLSNNPEYAWERSLDQVHAEQLDELIVAVRQPHQTFILKRGAQGARLYGQEIGRIDVKAHKVEVLNTIGAGDAFASGLIYSRRHGADWATAAEFANVCGAIVVTRHGCASAMPTLQEVKAILSPNN